MLATNLCSFAKTLPTQPQCNQFKACSPDTMTLKSYCDLKNFPPTAVYQLVTNCSCHLSSFSTKSIDAYCDMDTTDGGWMVIQRNIKNGVKTFDKKWKDFEEGFGDLTGGMDSRLSVALQKMANYKRWLKIGINISLRA